MGRKWPILASSLTSSGMLAMLARSCFRSYPLSFPFYYPGCCPWSLPTQSAFIPSLSGSFFPGHAQLVTSVTHKPQWLRVAYRIKSKTQFGIESTII